MPLTTIPEIGTRVVVTANGHPFVGKSGQVTLACLESCVFVRIDGHPLSSFINLADLDLALPRAA